MTPSNTLVHTDRLVQFYGPLTVEVVHHTPVQRFIYQRDGDNVARAHAITFFQNPFEWPDSVKQLAEQIRRGASMGVAFRDAGYVLLRTPLYWESRRLPDWLIDEFDAYPTTRESIVYGYRLSVSQDSEDAVPFGLVIEIHSPYTSFDVAPDIAPDLSQMDQNDALYIQRFLDRYLHI